MPYGYNGKILHVNLSSSTWEIEEPSETWYRTYVGGSSLASYYLLKDIKPGIDPLSEENVLVFACSVVTGAPLSGFSRYTVAAKSPLTGGFGEAVLKNRCIYGSMTVRWKSEMPQIFGERITGKPLKSSVKS
jgi:aldehyde:ferredoxin oxidoreductase